MSDSTPAVITGSSLVPASNVETAPKVSFIAPPPASDDAHRQLVAEAVQRMYSSDAAALFLDPSSENYRLSLSMPDGLAEAGILTLAAGRAMIAAIRGESSLRISGENPLSGQFYEGYLRVAYKGSERRLRVHLIPTAHGVAVSLRPIQSLPPDAGDLQALGLSEPQRTALETCLKGGGVVLIGGTNLESSLASALTLLSRAAALGRRAAVIAAEPGSDLGNIARIEAGLDDHLQAQALLSAAEAGMNCIALEQAPGTQTARAAATAAVKLKTAVLVPLVSKSALDAIGRFTAMDLPGVLRASVAVATCQMQLPLLCPDCARWGEVAADDLKFFDIKDTKFGSHVRNGCPRCNGEIVEFTNLFEVLTVPETVQASFRQESVFQNVQTELRNSPGYIPLLKMIVQAVTDARCSINEARQYYVWQIPQALDAVRGIR